MRENNQITATPLEEKYNEFSLKVEWNHFAGSVLEMKDEDLIYDKKEMIADELEVIKETRDDATSRIGDFFPRAWWNDIAKIATKHVDKLETELKKPVSNTTPFKIRA